MSLTRILVFLAIVLSLVGGLHFYFWARLVRDTALPTPYRAWATAAIIALALSLPAALVAGRRLPAAWTSLLAWPAFVWMGLMFLLFIALVATDVLRLGSIVAGRVVGQQALDPARRVLVARVLGAGAGLLAGASGAFSIHRARAGLRVRPVAITLAKLPRACDGTTIAHITDVHVGETIGRAYVEDIVARTNALAPDIIAITGDLVDGSVESLRDAVAPLAGLKAKHGVFFVTGNHEYFSGVTPWIRELERLGVRVLRNERVAIGQGDATFDLAGINDHSAARLGDDEHPNLPRALEGRDTTRALVLLAHQPKAVLEASRHAVDLQLSGHTHGGQIWPFNFLVRLQQPYVQGLSRHEGTMIYVSPGTGYWGPPMRLGTTAEIALVTLKAPSAGA